MWFALSFSQIPSPLKYVPLTLSFYLAYFRSFGFSHSCSLSSLLQARCCWVKTIQLIALTRFQLLHRFFPALLEKHSISLRGGGGSNRRNQIRRRWVVRVTRCRSLFSRDHFYSSSRANSETSGNVRMLEIEKLIFFICSCSLNLKKKI